MPVIKKITISILFFSILLIYPLNAQEKFLSLKKSKVNVRFGPSLGSPVKYIYKKKNLPLKQIDKKENFRRIIDLKNNTGWIHVSQLKPSNSIIILKNKVLFKRPSFFSRPIVRLAKERLLIIKKCQNKWCKVKTGDYFGWITTNNIWGSVN